MSNTMRKIAILLFSSSLLLPYWSFAEPEGVQSEDSKPSIAGAPDESFGQQVPLINAQSTLSDPYFPYVKRPLINSSEAKKTYSPEVLKDVAKRSTLASDHVPWTIKSKEPAKADSFKLNDIVLDRIKDPKTGKTYVKLYHGTTADLANVFKGGAKNIRFDLAELTALGQGFYLAGDINEAKYYACERLGARKWNTPEIKAMVLVIGVEENDLIKGKVIHSDQTPLSDPKTGKPSDESIYFGRNADRYNQFVFFSNVAPYLKIFERVVLPDGFGKARDRQDWDGLPTTSPLPQMSSEYLCRY